MTSSLTPLVSAAIVDHLSGLLPEPMTAIAHPGMGFDGVQITSPTPGNSHLVIYYDTTWGGDDGYSLTLRAYTTRIINHQHQLDDKPFPDSPAPTDPPADIAKAIARHAIATLTDLLNL